MRFRALKYMVGLLCGLAALATVLIQESTAQGQAIIADHTCLTSPEPNIPRQWLDRARALDVAFGHQSVGWNLLEGLDMLSNETPDLYKIDIVENPSPAWFKTHNGIAHFPIGDNGNPQSKASDFARQLTKGGYGRYARVAMMKFCFVDITPDTNVSSLWKTYCQTMESLERSCPGVQFVWWTCPLFERISAIALRCLHRRWWASRH